MASPNLSVLIRNDNQAVACSISIINLCHAAVDLVTKTYKITFFQCRHNLMLQRESPTSGNVFKKLKHRSIITGYSDIHWCLHLHILVDISTWNKVNDTPPQAWTLCRISIKEVNIDTYTILSGQHVCQVLGFHFRRENATNHCFNQASTCMIMPDRADNDITLSLYIGAFCYNLVVYVQSYMLYHVARNSWRIM